MKRLISSSTAGIINAAVIHYYGLECSEQRDLANLDPNTAYAITQAMKFAVQKKYPKAEEKQVNQLVVCVIRYIMHMEPEIAGKLTEKEPLLCAWGRVVDAIRKKLIKADAGSELSNEKVIAAIVPKLLKELERTFF